jgi:hypothetical protein
MEQTSIKRLVLVFKAKQIVQYQMSLVSTELSSTQLVALVLQVIQIVYYQLQAVPMEQFSI